MNKNQQQKGFDLSVELRHAPRFPMSVFEATADRIVVELPVKSKTEKTKSGLILPDSAKESQNASDQLFKVIKVGDGVQNKGITPGAFILAEGNTVLPFVMLDENNEEKFVSVIYEHNVVLIFDGPKMNELKRIAETAEKLAV